MGIISVRNLKKFYRTGSVVVEALRGVEFDVERGEFASIVGPSGCGKSTLLYILGGMLKATSGSVSVDGFDVTAAGESALVSYRRRDVGFVFQKFNLISSLNVFDNLKIACDLLQRADGARERIDSVLASVGVAHKRKMKPLELSQGEQQRVAIARALVREPKLLLADEPTGNLDTENSENIVRMFREISEQNGQTIVMITHNRALAAMTDRIIEMKDGRAIGSEGARIHTAPFAAPLGGAAAEAER
jgi:putative ABC transport system ATP-binding protein